MPRYWEGEGSPFQLEQRFDKYRNTVGQNKNLKQKVNAAWDDLRSDSEYAQATNRRVFIIAIVLILLFLYLINFDLSIFFP
ncbi:riboflavin synthase subunit beta [Aquimarina sp. ERC-38]|uniref:riboflavin synthase subunit beta n=1 Tax=Aquimarina sp. ERC-38 TaxID=2949996 RepID=UPI002AF6CB6E|nr:riboflavin synthase subunit beta [Aquimarina sp. ERC-38]